MQTHTTTPSLRARVAAWREAGERVALVPTMGNLHEGHLALVRRARELAPRVVSTIFVNPLQFGPDEDFESYPRTPDADLASLEAESCDLVFAPDTATVYPEGDRAGCLVQPPESLTDMLCGRHRPGHFTGVATVVAKLFNLVQPDLAVFGKKDYQQLAVIRRMTEDLRFPVEIVGVETVRETDGLALSSRNHYLSAEERAVAPELARTLAAACARLEAGERDYEAVAAEARQALEAAGFRPDYVEVRQADTLVAPGPETAELVVLAAAHLGRARLIDNREVTVGGLSG